MNTVKSDDLQALFAVTMSNDKVTILTGYIYADARVSVKVGLLKIKLLVMKL
jgi:hypothetical protein